MIDPGLKDKVVVVTGANHGIGAATAKAFAAQGAAVFVHYRPMRVAATTGTSDAYRASRAQTAEQVVQAIRSSGGQAAGWEGDFADLATVGALLDRAESTFGPVTVLINNAAHWEADTFASLTPIKRPADQWPPHSPAISAAAHDRHFAVNSRAIALLMAEFARRHVARGTHWGRIINISTEGAHCFPGEVSYGASKAALEAYSRSAAKELGPYGITVNIVSPGPVQTDWITPELEQALSAAIPLGRVGQPEDIADAIIFLASEQARWISGQRLHVSGGQTV